ncbi:ANTAR domain-containing protein [Streptomyces sp. NPDC046853]|uniref:ANTAR domain-containing protein n=1 Tax=unclassified Streptomyces TaxID=2593676 RepID=UPI0033D34F18
MEQSIRAAALHQWAVRKGTVAVEMRLQAISMRVSARAMRAGTPLIAPRVPNDADTAVEPSVQSAALIEEAKDILAARFRCTPEQALFLLHEHCRRTHLLLANLAHQVVHHHNLDS